MDGEGKNKDPYPQLLDLIHKDKEWVVRGEDENSRFGVSEEKKLELRLGPPGDQDWFINDTENNNTKKNNKNWLMNNMNHKVMCSPWSSSIPQHVKQTYLQTCSTKAVGELQTHQDKNACSASAAAVGASSGPAINTVNNNNNNNNTSQKRTAPSPVVGWPPIRSSRRNIASNSFSKLSSDQQNEIQGKEGKGKQDVCVKGLFVKINMDGVPIGRKVDLKAYDSYEKLFPAVDELFRGLLAVGSCKQVRSPVDSIVK
ncbi:hypothetical protein Syun_011441 [Stephania yunnanensis]|uniref:Auxin-responsive protein n=1 Tax=Stephania yunnanensis TaxID=152371 RepID=A0AAP0JXJ6_9MAGN